MNMIKKAAHLSVIILLALASIYNSAPRPVAKIALKNPYLYSLQEKVLSQKDLSLNDRWPIPSVNDVFKENILLNMAYLRGIVSEGKVDWDKVTAPFTYEFKLLPNQTFAFHQDVDAQYAGTVVKTTNAHFNSQEGFKSDGYLFGDGVCHLASLINWAAKDAHLSVSAPTPHDFAKIADIPKEYGVSIYNAPGATYANSKQNLYITNNQTSTITFKFEYKSDNLKVSIYE